MKILSQLGMASLSALAMVGVAVAQTDTGGYVEGSYSFIDADIGPFSEDGNAYGGFGAFAAPLTNSLSFQVDGGVNVLDFDGDDTETFFGQGHIFFNRSDRHAFGGGVTVADSDELLGETLFGGNVEGDFFLGNLTIGGEAGYYDVDEASIYGISGGADYFLSDSLRVGGNASFGTIDGDGSSEADFYGFEGEGEWLMSQFPLSFVASVSYNELDDANVDFTTIRLGVRYHFGIDDLITLDRRGASRDGGGNILKTVLFQ